MAHPIRPRNLLNPRVATYYAGQQGPPIDGRAPLAAPNNLELSAPHDWSAFDNQFHPAPAGTNRGSSAVLAMRNPGQSRLTGAPSDIQGPVVQGLLDRAAGVATPKPAPNAGAVARATGQQQVTPFGTVGEVPAARTAEPGTPIMENGQQVGIQGNPQQGPTAPTIAQARASTLQQYPGIATLGTPENAAFVAYAKQHGEAAAHQNLEGIINNVWSDQVARANAVGSGPNAAQTRSELPALGSSDATLSANSTAKNLAEMAANAQRVTDPNSILGKTADVLSHPGSSVDDVVGGAVRSGLQKIGIQPAAANTAANVVNTINPLNAIPQAGRWALNAATGGGNPPAQTASTPATNQPSAPPPESSPAPTPAPVAPASPVASSASADPDKVPNLAKGGRVPNRRMLSMPVAASPVAAPAMGAPASPPQPGQLPNLALGGVVSPSLAGNNAAGASAWRSNMTAGVQAQRADDASAVNEERGNMTSAGFPNTQVTAPTQDNEFLNENSGGHISVPNYARGKTAGLPQAMARERMAISHHVGGAPKSARPEAVNLPGAGPAVINSSEQVLPNMADGSTEVLNRDQQRRMPDRKTLSMPAYAGGFVPPSHKGRLHRALGIPEGHPIPHHLLRAARNSDNPHIRAMAVEAENMQMGRNAR